MRDFSLHLFGKSIVDVIFAEVGHPYGHAMGTALCAHATELAIKARIAQEHPLLLFDRLPKQTDGDSLLNIDLLLTSARTVPFNELPNLLWATTGYRINGIQQLVRFQQIRNALMHLGIPPINLRLETLSFAFQVAEPMFIDFWNIDVLNFLFEYDPDCEEYLSESLREYGITHPRLNP
ncbi:MAG: hypothetical protein ACTHJG_05695 [Rhodanobacteraceae bacterium]